MLDSLEGIGPAGGMTGIEGWLCRTFGVVDYRFLAEQQARDAIALLVAAESPDDHGRYYDLYMELKRRGRVL